MDLDWNIDFRALVLSLVRFVVEEHGGTIQTNPIICELKCMYVPHGRSNACHIAILRALGSLKRSMVFCLERPDLYISRS